MARKGVVTRLHQARKVSSQEESGSNQAQEHLKNSVSCRIGRITGLVILKNQRPAPGSGASETQISASLQFLAKPEWRKAIVMKLQSSQPRIVDLFGAGLFGAQKPLHYSQYGMLLYSINRIVRGGLFYGLFSPSGYPAGGPNHCSQAGRTTTSALQTRQQGGTEIPAI